MDKEYLQNDNNDNDIEVNTNQKNYFLIVFFGSVLIFNFISLIDSIVQGIAYKNLYFYMLENFPYYVVNDVLAYIVGLLISIVVIIMSCFGIYYCNRPKDNEKHLFLLAIVILLSYSLLFSIVYGLLLQYSIGIIIACFAFALVAAILSFVGLFFEESAMKKVIICILICFTICEVLPFTISNSNVDFLSVIISIFHFISILFLFLACVIDFKKQS